MNIQPAEFPFLQRAVGEPARPGNFTLKGQRSVQSELGGKEKGSYRARGTEREIL